MIATRINFLSVAQDNLPAALERPISRAELNFLEREVIPRLFAASIACLALLQAAAHATLSTTHFVSFLISLPLREREAYLAIFERARTFLFYALEDASVGVLIFHGLWDPEQIVEAAFPAPVQQEGGVVPVHVQPQAVAPVSEPRVNLVAVVPAERAAAPPVDESLLLRDFSVTIHSAEQPALNIPTVVSDLAPEPVADIASIPSPKSSVPEVVSEIGIVEIAWHGFESTETVESGAPVDKVVPAAVLVEAPVLRIEVIDVVLTPAAALHLENERQVGPVPAPVVLQDPYLAIVEPHGYAEAIDKIIKLLDETSTVTLARDSHETRIITDLGTKVEGHNLHTLKFLECIVRNPITKQHLSNVQNGWTSGFKWRGFLWGKSLKREGQDGIGGFLDKLVSTEQFEPYLDGFIKALATKGIKLSRRHLDPFIKKQPPDWEGMFKYLLSSKG